MVFYCFFQGGEELLGEVVFVMVLDVFGDVPVLFGVEFVVEEDEVVSWFEFFDAGEEGVFEWRVSEA